jgi:hypothetical protein
LLAAERPHDVPFLALACQDTPVPDSMAHVGFLSSRGDRNQLTRCVILRRLERPAPTTYRPQTNQQRHAVVTVCTLQYSIISKSVSPLRGRK